MRFTTEEAKAFLHYHVGYLKKSPENVGRRLGLSTHEARSLMKEVKWERVKAKADKKAQEGYHTDFIQDSDYQQFLTEQEIDPSEIRYVWRKQKGDGTVRFTVGTSPNNELNFPSLKDDVLRAVKEADYVTADAPEYVFDTPEDGVHSGNISLIHIPDVHLGKTSWESLEYAKQVVLNTTSRLLHLSHNHAPEKIIIPLGHDFLHIDKENITRKGTFQTTSSLTEVEVSHPWHELFIAGIFLGKAVTNLALEFTNKVEIVTVLSNHSEQSDFAIGEVLKASFEGNERVTIDNGASYYKTCEWGVNGLLLTHGHTVSWNNLPQLFASSFPELWGRTKYREVVTGHGHHRKVASTRGIIEEKSGVTLRMSPSLSRQDSWHMKYGYSAIPGAEAFIYNKEQGLIASYPILDLS